MLPQERLSSSIGPHAHDLTRRLLAFDAAERLGTARGATDVQVAPALTLTLAFTPTFSPSPTPSL